MTGQQLCEAARDGDAAKVSTLLSTQGAQSFINYQEVDGGTALHAAAFGGHVAVTKQLLAARCNVDLLTNDGATALQVAERQGHAGIATLIRNKTHKSADRGKKEAPQQASP
jgi:ankyrin repeat protein